MSSDDPLRAGGDAPPSAPPSAADTGPDLGSDTGPDTASDTPSSQGARDDPSETRFRLSFDMRKPQPRGDRPPRYRSVGSAGGEGQAAPVPIAPAAGDAANDPDGAAGSGQRPLNLPDGSAPDAQPAPDSAAPDLAETGSDKAAHQARTVSRTVTHTVTHMGQGTDAKGPRIKTPDGRSFATGAASKPLHHLLGFTRSVVRLIAKAIMTVWRMAGALDSALWRGTRLIVLSIVHTLLESLLFIADVVRDLVRWLPSRGGRAYTAVSGVVLIVSSLWIFDELHNAARVELTQTGGERPPTDVADPILARIGGRYVRISDIEAAARASGQIGENERLSPRAAFDRGLVKSFVEQRLLAQRAVAAGLAREPQISQRLLVARDRILAAEYLARQIDRATDDATIAAFYQSQADVTRLGDEVRAQHIVVATEEEARALHEAVSNGEDFTTLARTKSTDRATAPLGGELGYFTKDMMAPALANAAFRTEPGELAPVFYSEFGWHVLRVIDRRPSSEVSLAEVEERIREFLTLRAINEAVSEVTEEGGIVYYRPDRTGEAEAGTR